jgi:hypothetical protein
VDQFVSQMLGKRKGEDMNGVAKKSRTGEAPSLKRKRAGSEEREMKKQKTETVESKKRKREDEPNSPKKKANAPPQSYLGKRKRGKGQEGVSKKPKTSGRGARPSGIITTNLAPSAQGRTGMTMQGRAENKSAPKNRDQLPSPRPRRRR